MDQDFYKRWLGDVKCRTGGEKNETPAFET